jgi:stage V sporulation protein B
LKRGTFVKGAVILAFTGIVVKFIGAAMRIVLAALMGDEGIGLYQMAYPVYVTLLTISTAGIPVAISKLVAEKLALNNHSEAYRVYRVSLIILTITGFVISLVLACGARYFAINIAKDPRAYLPILAISPAIFFVTIMSAMRGFFQGHQQMVPTAISQFMEQLARVITSVALVIYLLSVSLEHAAAGAAFGAVTGGLIGLLVLVIIYYRQKSDFLESAHRQTYRGKKDTTLQIIGRIISLSIPITLGSIMVPLINLLDLAIVPARLHAAGFSTERATALYGQLTGMALSLMYFPSVIVIALAISLVPAISEAYTLKNRPLMHNRIEISNRLTVLFALPSAVGLFLLSLPMLSNAVTVLLYNNTEAAYPLSILSWGIIFFSFYLTTTGILQGMGYTLIPVLNMFYGAVVKVVLTWILTAIPSVHIGGAALSTTVGFFVVAVLNIVQVARKTGYRFRIGPLFFKPIVSVLVMSITVIYFYRLVLSVSSARLGFGAANGIATCASILVGAAVYFAALLYLGWLTEDDLYTIPRIGGNLVQWVRKLRLIK